VVILTTFLRAANRLLFSLVNSPQDQGPGLVRQVPAGARIVSRKTKPFRLSPLTGLSSVSKRAIIYSRERAACPGPMRGGSSPAHLRPPGERVCQPPSPPRFCQLFFANDPALRHKRGICEERGQRAPGKPASEVDHPVPLHPKVPWSEEGRLVANSATSFTRLALHPKVPWSEEGRRLSLRISREGLFCCTPRFRGLRRAGRSSRPWG